MTNPNPKLNEICKFAGEVHMMFTEMDKKTRGLSSNSRECYEIRKEGLANILNVIESGIEKYPDSLIIQDLKHRCNHSIRIMEIANTMGVINQP